MINLCNIYMHIQQEAVYVYIYIAACPVGQAHALASSHMKSQTCVNVKSQLKTLRVGQNLKLVSVVTSLAS